MNEILETQLEIANQIIKLKNQRIASLIETNQLLNNQLSDLQKDIDFLTNKQNIEDKIYNIKLQISLGE